MSEITEHTDQHNQMEFRRPDGVPVGLVSNWNDGHSRGNWMAQWKPLNWRDSGMKRFKTQRGAAVCVRAKVALMTETQR